MTLQTVSLLISTNSNNIKGYLPSNNNFDAVILQVRDSGAFVDARQLSISSSITGINMNLGFNALGKLGDAYVFAGWALGYMTLLQQVPLLPNSLEDTFVFSYLFEKNSSYQCIYEQQLFGSTFVSPILTSPSGAASYSTVVNNNLNSMTNPNAF